MCGVWGSRSDGCGESRALESMGAEVWGVGFRRC